MKKLIILLLFSNMSLAETVCKEVCPGVTEEQRSCVMKASCEPKLSKLRLEIAALKKKIAELETRAPKIVHDVKTEIVKVEVKKLIYRKNNINILIGYGTLGTLREDKDGSDTIFRTQHGPVLGLQYSRLFTQRMNWLLQAQTNETVSLGLGFNW